MNQTEVKWNAWIEPLERQILEYAAVGWTPTTPVPATGHVTQDWPLASLETALNWFGAYLLFVAVGMLVMPLLPAVPSKVFYPLKFVYNPMQMFLCAYMTIEAFMIVHRNNYTFFPLKKNNPFDAANPPFAKLLWLFYISKLLDFFDTFTIVLSKKWDQLSFLHVYHHSSIFMFYWLNLRLGYDGDIFLTVILNGGIHAVMYTYYFLSMHTRDIWWKKYLTACQIMQFCTMITQASMMLLNGDSTFPPRMTLAYFFYIITMLVLFTHFFLQSYCKPKAPKESVLKGETAKIIKAE